MRKQLLTIILLFILNPLFSQETDTIQEQAKMRFTFGIGPMNLSKYQEAGITIENSFEYIPKDWLIFAASLHLGKSGNKNTDFTDFKYFPDFPENIETNFYETDFKSTSMNGFSSIGVFALINPARLNKTRFIFGPGICFHSWKEITTTFAKEFRDYEYYKIVNRITNRKQLSLGARFSLERDLSEKLFVGIKFQGYFAEGEVSSLLGMVGFRLN